MNEIQNNISFIIGWISILFTCYFLWKGSVVSLDWMLNAVNNRSFPTEEKKKLGSFTLKAMLWALLGFSLSFLSSVAVCAILSLLFVFYYSKRMVDTSDELLGR